MSILLNEIVKIRIIEQQIIKFAIVTSSDLALQFLEKVINCYQAQSLRMQASVTFDGCKAFRADILIAAQCQDARAAHAV